MITKSTTKRFRVEPTKVKGIPVYAVVDTYNGHWVSVKDCMLWAKHKADELNAEAARRQSETQGAEKPEEKGIS